MILSVNREKGRLIFSLTKFMLRVNWATWRIKMFLTLRSYNFFSENLVYGNILQFGRIYTDKEVHHGYTQ